MPRSTAPLRVVVLDDDRGLRERILLPELREHGFEAAGAATAAELYRLMLHQRFDLALLDIGLPDEDGVSVAGHLRSLQPGIGIVMLTGNHDRNSHLQSLSRGADAFLTKPVDVDILMATLHQLVRRLAPAPPATPAPGAAGSSAGARGWGLEADGWCLISPCGAALGLSQLERRLMRVLVEAGGRPVARETLIRALVAEGEVHDFDPRRLDMLVHRLRRKVSGAVDGSTRFPLMAARGVGYLFAG